MKPTCFAIMPFDESFDEISDIIRAAADACGLEYVRGDLRKQPGSVMAQVVRDILQAKVVVADITGHNANVFYELGIAHQRSGTERVVIITQSTEDSPYDVHEFRQLQYKHSAAGRQKLAKDLPSALRAALQAEPESEQWGVIRGRTQRTRVIVRDLRRLVGANEDGVFLEAGEAPRLEGVVIRSSAGLSSLSISDHEPPDAEEGSEYDAGLKLERDTLRQALLQGATFKSLLNPPRAFAKRMRPERLKARYRRLIGLLRGESDATDPEQAAWDVAAMTQCQWAINPVPAPNLLILGADVAYEGFKRGGTRGFEHTHCEIDSGAITRLIDGFDAHFEDCFEPGTTPSELADTLQAYFDQAESEQRGRS